MTSQELTLSAYGPRQYRAPDASVDRHRYTLAFRYSDGSPFLHGQRRTLRIEVTEIVRELRRRGYTHCTGCDAWNSRATAAEEVGCCG